MLAGKLENFVSCQIIFSLEFTFVEHSLTIASRSRSSKGKTFSGAFVGSLCIRFW